MKNHAHNMCIKVYLLLRTEIYKLFKCVIEDHIGELNGIILLM